MSLLQEIISEAIAKDADVPRLLRLCMLFASRLGHTPLKNWAMQELEGYSDDAPLPSYRVLKCQNKGYFLGMTLKGVLELPVSILPEDIRERYRQVEFRSSIAECVDLGKKVSTDGVLQVPWPVNLAVKYGSKMANGSAQCTSAWMEISPSEVVGLVDVIKTKVLAFAIEIEQEDPSAGDIPTPGSTKKIQEAKLTQIFNTTIHGGTVQNLALGNASVFQSAISGIQPGDVSSLVKALATIGVEQSRLATLETAIATDSAAGMKGMGAKVKDWLSELAMSAGQKAAEHGVDSIVTFAAQALGVFFRINSAL